MVVAGPDKFLFHRESIQNELDLPGGRASKLSQGFSRPRAMSPQRRQILNPSDPLLSKLITILGHEAPSEVP